LSAPFTHSSAQRGATALAWALVCLNVPLPAAAALLDPAKNDIRLELSPRICTLGSHDTQCETKVQASWHSPREESLCLVIVDRPEVKQCWERYDQGVYTIDLIFSDDVTFQLKDLELQHVLASEAIRVIREAIQYRHRRRQPWNVFD
jgi:hypothetical protein